MKEAALAAGDYKPGDVLGKYRVLEVIGRGSNGVTYKVWHTSGHAISQGQTCKHYLCRPGHASRPPESTVLIV